MTGVPATSGPALRLRGITKTFGHVVALAGVDMEARSGEVLAIVGDNGAGKSTLIKVVSGVYRPDAGLMEIQGAAAAPGNPAEARRAGIATVFQDLALVEVLDVATNMFLGQFPRRGWFIDRAAMESESRAFLDSLGVTVASVRSEVGMLSGGQRQIIAIARAMRAGGKVVLLDEPTAALGVRETGQAAQLIQTLKDQGCAVICVSHDMSFVFDIADRIQVMRLGRIAGNRQTSATTREEIVGLITGSVAADFADNQF